MLNIWGSIKHFEKITYLTIPLVRLSSHRDCPPDNMAQVFLCILLCLVAEMILRRPYWVNDILSVRGK